MENQYYALVEKQDFFEIIENKFGELAIFIDARKNEPLAPLLEYNGASEALLKRDNNIAIKLEGINTETGALLAEQDFVLIIELDGDKVERTYGVPVDIVDDFSIYGKNTRADELEISRNKNDLLKAFGAVKVWKSGGKSK